ncbi:Arylsulfatase [Rubripirellula lacrimiformis]|uniref:Arylsulfatase n=2 Tax=Rubripirellula lacrimiformis TaxID=1930273 RepID=A0A517N9M0_9BACT|nr:Arylsulfatase [Rubripirellula lacrimiformis]
MLRPTFGSFIGIWIFILGGAIHSGWAQSSAPPNFVVFVADDMAWEDCGANGNPAVRTPNIDRLAAQGMRFTRAVLTCSSCSPSRSSILTGRYPHNTGAGELHLPLPGDSVLLTSPLRQVGYWTAAIGKWHVGEAVGDQVEDRQGSPPPKMGDAWVAALQRRPKDQPFFLWAAHLDPHRAYQKGAVDPPHDPADVIVPPMFPDTLPVRQDIALYYDEITRFDQHIGQVLDELDAQGVADNTMVLVISDNGRPFPHCKTRVDLPGVGTPFVVRWPARVKPGISDALVSSLDIAPTITKLAGASVSDTFQGRDFSPLLWDPTAEIRQYAFAEHNWHDYRAFERGVHNRQYCYVRNWLPGTPGTPPADAVNSPTFAEMKRLLASGDLTQAQASCFVTPRPTEMLYDVHQDPNCLDNLAADPEMRSVLDQMRSALSQWQDQTTDRFPGEHRLTPDGFDRQTGKKLPSMSGAHPGPGK